jgi:hypothetical protein
LSIDNKLYEIRLIVDFLCQKILEMNMIYDENDMQNNGTTVESIDGCNLLNKVAEISDIVKQVQHSK